MLSFFSWKIETVLFFLAEKEKNVLFGGRLGGYRYYDMDKVLRAALDMAEQELA